MGPWRKAVPALAGGSRPGLRLAGGLCSRRVACRARAGRGVAPGPAPGGGGGCIRAGSRAAPTLGARCRVEAAPVPAAAAPAPAAYPSSGR
jgi:hypothetical protein